MKSLSDRPSGAVVQVPFQPCPERVRQILRAAGVESFRGSCKPLLKSRHIQDRLEFATTHQDFNFKKAVFSDEKTIRIRTNLKGDVFLSFWSNTI